MNKTKKHKLFLLAFFAAFAVAGANRGYGLGNCGSNKACKLFINLTAVNPTRSELKQVEDKISAEGMESAAEWIVASQKEFQTVQLKSWAEPWADKDGKKGSALNDTILTLVVSVMQDIDFRRIMYDDIIARGLGEVKGEKADQLELPDGTMISGYFRSSNKHYSDLEAKETYHKANHVGLMSQVPQTFSQADAVAGVLSTNGFGRAAYTAGTNRRTIPMLLREAMCLDIEELRDATVRETFIMRDVGVTDSDQSVTTFKTVCKTCHGLMDQIAPAFIHYDISAGASPSVLFEKIEPVKSTNKAMKVVNPTGYIPKNDEWRALFTESQVRLLGWPADAVGGFGAKSLGKAISETEAFASCQPKRAFQTVCGRKPLAADEPFMASLRADFKESNYRLKRAFVKAAVYCATGD